MGGCNGACSASGQILQNRYRQRCSLCWVRSCAQLIQEHQTAFPCFPHDLNDIGHVGGKGAETLLYALLITDISKYAPVDRHSASGRCRDVEPRLRHEGQKPCSLERDSLTARIRSCDDQCLISFADGNIHRYDFVFIDERVSCLPQLQDALFVDFRTFCAHLYGQLTLCHEQIQLQKQFLVIDQIVIGFGYHVGEFTQYPVHFGLFVQFQLPEFIVHVHDDLRLDEKRCSAAALVMDDAGHSVFVFLFDRDHVSPISYSNDGILKDRSLGIEYLVHFGLQSVALAHDGLSDAPQFRAGAVGHFVL